MNTAATITAAFNAQKTRMVEQMVAGLERDLTEMKADENDASKSRYWSAYWTKTLRPMCVLVGGQPRTWVSNTGEVKPCPYGNTVGGEWVLDIAKATTWADAWAAAELEAAAAKLIAKVGDLKHVKIIGAPERGTFTLVGHHHSYATVRVEQTRVLKSSSKGTLFNQWPARIYVDNRPVSEAAYKQLSPRPEDRVLPEIAL